jgi:hypothetical protein
MCRTLLTEILKNLFFSVNTIRSRYIRNFLGKRIGNGHLGKLELDGNTLLISFFGNRVLDWRGPNSKGIGLISTTSMQ